MKLGQIAIMILNDEKLAKKLTMEDLKRILIMVQTTYEQTDREN